MAETKSPTIQEAVTVFILDVQARHATEATLEYYEYRLKVFADWCQTQELVYLDDLTANHIRAYLAHQQNRKLSGYTLLNAARTVRALLNFCVREEWLTQSPMAKVRMPKVEKKLPATLSAQDINALLDAARTPRERALVLFLLDTGLRAAEFVSLNGGDIDMKTGAVFIRKGKGRKERSVYLGARARRQLAKYYAEQGAPKENAPVWTSVNTGDRLTRSGLFQLTRRLGKRADVHPCTPHMFRRTFAITCLRNGMNIYALQRLMGHEDLDTLRLYLKLVESDLEDAHKKHGPVDNMR